jgi:hypothetical protein
MTGRRYRGAVAWVAAAALLGNVLALLAPAKATQVVDDILGLMIICTADGAKLVDHGGGSSPARHDQNGWHCPSCVLLKTAALAAEITVERFPRPHRHTRPSESGAPSAGPRRLSLGGIGCRAPPFVA